MALPRRPLHISRAKAPIKAFQRRFSQTPRNNRLGASLYPQEWTHATYHYNKALSKTLPVAAAHTEHLLTAYATQTRRRVDKANPLYNQITRTNIAQQRRQAERVFISKATTKDFGDRVELTAFVYDGFGAAEREREEAARKRMGVKADGTKGDGGQRRRRGPPGGRGRAMGGAIAVGGAGGAAGGFRRAGGPGAGSPGFRRGPSNGAGGGGQGGAPAFRRGPSGEGGAGRQGAAPGFRRFMPTPAGGSGEQRIGKGNDGRAPTR